MQKVAPRPLRIAFSCAHGRSSEATARIFKKIASGLEVCQSGIGIERKGHEDIIKNFKPDVLFSFFIPPDYATPALRVVKRSEWLTDEDPNNLTHFKNTGPLLGVPNADELDIHHALCALHWLSKNRLI